MVTHRTRFVSKHLNSFVKYRDHGFDWGTAPYKFSDYYHYYYYHHHWKKRPNYSLDAVMFKRKLLKFMIEVFEIWSIFCCNVKSTILENTSLKWINMSVIHSFQVSLSHAWAHLWSQESYKKNQIQEKHPRISICSSWH